MIREHLGIICTKYAGYFKCECNTKILVGSSLGQLKWSLFTPRISEILTHGIHHLTLLRKKTNHASSALFVRDIKNDLRVSFLKASTCAHDSRGQTNVTSTHIYWVSAFSDEWFFLKMFSGIRRVSFQISEHCIRHFINGMFWPYGSFVVQEKKVAFPFRQRLHSTLLVWPWK